MLKKYFNKKEFEKLFKEHYEELYIKALSFLDNEDEAHDIVHDAFGRLWGQIGKIEIENRRAFLYAMIRNLSVDALRKRKTADKYQAWLVYTVSEVDAQNGEQEEQIREVEKLIEKLPSLTQMILQACFFKQQTYKEAGLQLGISEGTVKYHIRYALRTLKKQITLNT